MTSYLSIKSLVVRQQSTSIPIQSHHSAYIQHTNVYTFYYTQGAGPYANQIKQTEDDITGSLKKVNELAGVKESDTGLAAPALWDLPADKQALQSEEPLQVCIQTSVVD